MFFQKRKKTDKKSFDRENQRPVQKCSICTGERVAGFKDVHTGKFEEVCLIRSEEDLKHFADMYGIRTEDITKEY